MNKKLPNLYVNKIEKKIANNATVFYSAFKDNVKEEIKIDKAVTTGDLQSIEDKINELFESPNYVYKMGVAITLKNKTVIKKDIIGQVDNKLITMDEDLINIDDIEDIKF